MIQNDFHEGKLLIASNNNCTFSWEIGNIRKKEGCKAERKEGFIVEDRVVQVAPFEGISKYMKTTDLITNSTLGGKLRSSNKSEIDGTFVKLLNYITLQTIVTSFNFMFLTTSK